MIDALLIAIIMCLFIGLIIGVVFLIPYFIYEYIPKLKCLTPRNNAILYVILFILNGYIGIFIFWLFTLLEDMFFKIKKN